mmetsp:Transcript_67381/g.140404  ORF Transcript_67381/g.140404 Transcript_67381/m.140404 type:complete len:213 (+) Transcript_67381:206-844(+)
MNSLPHQPSLYSAASRACRYRFCSLLPQGWRRANQPATPARSGSLTCHSLVLATGGRWRRQVEPSRNLNVRSGDLVPAISNSLRVALDVDFLIFEPTHVVAILVSTQECKGENRHFELHRTATKHRAHWLFLLVWVIVLPHEFDRDQVHVIRIVLVLLPNEAEVVDIAFLLFQIILDPVMQTNDLSLLFLPNEHVLEPRRVVLPEPSIWRQP